MPPSVLRLVSLSLESKPNPREKRPVVIRNHATVLPFRGRGIGNRSRDGSSDSEAAALPSMNSHGGNIATLVAATGGAYSYFRGYLATCSCVKRDVNPRQNQRRVIRHLRTILRDFQLPGMQRVLKTRNVRVWDSENARSTGYGTDGCLFHLAGQNPPVP